MLTKEQCDLLKMNVQHIRPDLVRAMVGDMIAEYDRANPPPPLPKVSCPSCGDPMKLAKDHRWVCTDLNCALIGPETDDDGRKVMALGKRKLPLKPPFVVVGTKVYPVTGLRELKKGDRFFANALCTAHAGMDHEREKIERPILGDPIDISEFLE